MLVIQSKRRLQCLTYYIGKIMLLVCFLYCTYKIYIPKANYENDQLLQDNLMKFKDIEFIIDNDMCTKTDINLLAIILVTSFVGNKKMRLSHRMAISQEDLIKMKLLRIFLTAEIPYNDTTVSNQELLLEHNKFNDLIQGNFIDSYRNLTYKSAMGFKWVTTNCAKVKYIIKTDDDTVFDIYYLTNFLENYQAKLKNITEFIAGNILYSRVPIRNQSHILFVSEAEYEKKKYPLYTAGMLYITNPKTAKKLLIASETTKYLWIEDIFFTGILRLKSSIYLYQMSNWFTYKSVQIQCCLEIMKKWGYVCNYHIGPNDGDTELLGQFIQENRKCYFKKCVKRGDLCVDNSIS